MGATSTGRIKQFCAKIGIAVDDYFSRQALGLKWCYRCKDWHARAAFAVDRSRYDSLTAGCRPKKFVASKTPEELRVQANATYRRYYAGPAGLAIRLRIHARQRKVDPIDPELALRLLEDHNGKCVYCGSDASGFDHLFAVTRGGNSLVGNILPACRSCNSSKGNRDLFEWLEKKGMQVPPDVVDALMVAEANGYGAY